MMVLSSGKQIPSPLMGEEEESLETLANRMEEILKERRHLIEALCPLSIKSREKLDSLLAEKTKDGSAVTFSQKYSPLGSDEAWEFFRIVSETDNVEKASRVYNVLLRSSTIKGSELGRSNDSSLDLGQLATVDALLSKAVTQVTSLEVDSDIYGSPADIFLAMYRGLLTPEKLVDKLIWRYISSSPLPPGGVFDQDWTSAMRDLEFLIHVINDVRPEELNSKSIEILGITLFVKSLSNLLIMDVSLLILMEEIISKNSNHSCKFMLVEKSPSETPLSQRLQELHTRIIDSITGVANGAKAKAIHSPKLKRWTGSKSSKTLSDSAPSSPNNNNTTLSDSDLIEAIDSM
ncbi:hypothetical protein Ciccas_006726 [Cichlidogyrus casuarinus]|uniref:Uncharacterized protein n=1 Tax=Cichlidogyrus casuarinus TaxID=1844966 RepID=A0ABD2Q659_9PLAT